MILSTALKMSIVLVLTTTSDYMVQGSNKSDTAKNIKWAKDIPGLAACICMALYDPICAIDGNTYGNSCVLNCARKYGNPFLIGLCKGECPCCKEPYENEPIEFDFLPPGWGLPPPNYGLTSPAQQVSEESDDKEKAGSPRCSCIYDPDATPVCANDGRTYGSECELFCEAFYKPGLKKRCDGSCPCKCSCNCPH